MIFSTVHRSKGMEYDTVQLVNDFLSEGKIKKLMDDNGARALNATKLNEEINLLYVAVTRTKNSIHIPEALLPDGFPGSAQIHVVKAMDAEEQDRTQTTGSVHKEERKADTKEKAYSVDEVRTRHSGAYKPWTPELDEELTVMYCEGITTKDMAKHFGRTKGAILSRIKKLELEELYG